MKIQAKSLAVFTMLIALLGVGVALAVTPTSGHWTDTGKNGIYRHVVFVVLDAGELDPGGDKTCPRDAHARPWVWDFLASYNLKCPRPAPGQGLPTDLPVSNEWRKMTKVSGGFSFKTGRGAIMAMDISGRFTSTKAAKGTARLKWTCKRGSAGHLHAYTVRTSVNWKATWVGPGGPRGGR